MRSVDDDDDFEAAAQEALLLATAESESQLLGTRRTASQNCPVAVQAVVEVMD